MKRFAHPSTVLSLMALFVALAGTSYAALKLPANSVGSKQIKRGAVTRAKLRAGTVGRDQIGADAVTGNEIADGSIESFDLAAGVIPPPTPATVVATVQGPRSTVCALGTSCAVAGSAAACPAGSRVIAGGIDNFTGGTAGEYSEPSSDRSAWLTGVANASDHTGGWVQAYAMCATTGKAVETRKGRLTLRTRRDIARAMQRLRRP